MKMHISPFFALSVLLITMFAFQACEKKGPAEKIGESIDNASEEMRDAIEPKGPAEKVGESIDNAVDKK